VCRCQCHPAPDQGNLHPTSHPTPHKPPKSARPCSRLVDLMANCRCRSDLDCRRCWIAVDVGAISQDCRGGSFQIEHRLRHRSFFNSDGRERRLRANSPQESLYLFQSPSMALAISLAAERNQFDFLRPKSFKMPATWRLLPR